MTGIRERRAVFGEAADAYEAARPGYPSGLVDDVLAHARLGDAAGLGDAPVLEVGAGTGKASVAFAGRGLALTCLEPDARMAAVLTRACAPYPGTAVVVTGFEQWQPPAERFGLLFSAQAWHWVDPASRWTLAFDALRPGGTIALFWNRFSVDDTALRSALTAAHARHDAAELAPNTLGDPEPAVADPAPAWPLTDLLADTRYRDAETRSYPARHTFTRDRYLDLLASISAYRMLPESWRVPLFADIARTVDDRGGSFELEVETHLYLARTSDRP
ncbi:trans-aconitate 2-methyltransferase [Streptacidiphilus sp. N1-3]|uniref:Trans-aconitate 2-methyltransferase n=1 Tax=Streptacidiphilus alkalitolerans TaxID=3342712 RepID=A0ABV6X3L3_9ACTN